jgi:flagellar protein FlbD
MIQLTRLNKQPLVLNSDLIKFIEYAPDTVITLVNGEKVVVLETGEQILEQIVEFRRRVLGGLPMNFTGWTSPNEEAPEVKPQDPHSEKT